MSYIKSIVSEYYQLKKDIDYHKTVLKNLNDRKKRAEVSIIDHLEQNNLNGVRYKDLYFQRKTSTRHVPKKKDDKIEDIRDTLSKYVVNSEEIADEIIKTLKGEEVDKHFLSIKKKKK